MTEEDLMEAVKFLKGLADETRLRILGLLSAEDRTVEELATLLGLKAPTVSHHLAKLKELGLVTMTTEATSHIYRLDREALRGLGKLLAGPETVTALADDVGGDAWERKVLQDWLDGETLKGIPARRKKLDVIIRWLARDFEPGVRYREKEVNEILKRHHPDFATLRRELVDARLLARENGVYWLTGREEAGR